MLRILICFILLTLAAPILARADGTTDITIDPVFGNTISAPGSYRLAADVVMTANSTPITVNANNVTIDLNGHTITGSPINGANGISANSSSRLHVYGGRITGFRAWGIWAGARARIHDCEIFGNNTLGFAGGISVDAGSIVRDCIITENTATGGTTIGLSAGASSHIIGNVVQNNDSATHEVIGIKTLAGCVITDNAVQDNTVLGGVTIHAYGIQAGDRCVIRQNSVTNNDTLATTVSNATGISAGSGCVIQGNSAADQTAQAGNSTGILATSSTITENDCMNNNVVAGGGEARGISANSNSIVRGNHCEGNSTGGGGRGLGILAAANCRIQENHCVANGGSNGWGIRTTGIGNFIAGNTTAGHPDGGIILVNGNNTRVELNRYRDPTGIDNIEGQIPSSLGAGDLGGLIY